MRMTAWVPDKTLLGRDGTVNVPGRYLLLFREAVGNYGGNILMKEVKHAIIHAPDADAKFVDAITQVIGLGAAQLMAEIPKPLQLDAAFIEPFPGSARTIPGWGPIRLHPGKKPPEFEASLPPTLLFAYLRTVVKLKVVCTIHPSLL